jgi:hypothetical protein
MTGLLLANNVASAATGSDKATATLNGVTLHRKVASAAMMGSANRHAHAAAMLPATKAAMPKNSNSVLLSATSTRGAAGCFISLSATYLAGSLVVNELQKVNGALCECIVPIGQRRNMVTHRMNEFFESLLN